MNNLRKSIWLFYLVLLLSESSAYSQVINTVGISDDSTLNSDFIMLSDSTTLILPETKPLLSFKINNKLFNSGAVVAVKRDDSFLQIFEGYLEMNYIILRSEDSVWKAEINFKNTGPDTVSVSNVVPFGENKSSVYITGNIYLGASHPFLFRPGYTPLRVILPDNALDLGYSSFSAGSGLSVCSVVRPFKLEGSRESGCEIILPPGSQVTYRMYADIFQGEWQNGLRKVFRDKYIYDLEKFDNSLFERDDLAWIKGSYLIVMKMAGDREFYDRITGRYTYGEVIKKGMEQFGYIDVFGICPIGQQLGLDQRNQWDLYRDLPGGAGQLRSFVRMSRQSGTRFFIAYEREDTLTGNETPYGEMSRLMGDIEADGILFDASDSSAYYLQSVVDSVRKGVVIYSQGMPVPKNMQGLITGRIKSMYLSPELNLNKLIKPDLSLFRVCDVAEDIIHRELAISFFNGHGTELNMIRPPGKDEDYLVDLGFLARTTFILRQNNDAFLDNNWTPLIETTLDNVFVNRWKSGDKTVFTVLNMRHEGVNGNLFKISNTERRHYISVWNHESLLPLDENGYKYISAKAVGWHPSYEGTRREGSVDCIVEFPDLIQSRLIGDSIKICSTGAGKLLIWKGNPSYQNISRELKILNDTTIRIKDLFGSYEGKMVLQLIENKILKDENVHEVKSLKPWIISKVVSTVKASEILSDMALVQGALFSFNVSPVDRFISYPDVSDRIVKIDSFLIDKYPVTNAQYYEFIIKSGYRPADTARFLRHWQSGIYRQGQDRYPVVYLSYEDMVAYAKWAGKRLPTEAEWQLAAQGLDKRKWPWGDEFHGTYCNNSFGRSTPVNAFPKGQSPSGVIDMVGNVWQMTNDMYSNGTNYFTVIRGGSNYRNLNGLDRFQGGPQPLDKTQILLMVSPGYDRSSVIGFRCVKDIDSKIFKQVD